MENIQRNKKKIKISILVLVHVEINFKFTNMGKVLNVNRTEAT